MAPPAAWFNIPPVQLNGFSATPSPDTLPREALSLGECIVPLVFVRHDRARRYVLRLCPDGTARVTVPRRGSLREARAFVESQAGWLTRQLARQHTEISRDRHWRDGTSILFRGLEVSLRIELAEGGVRVRFADQVVEVGTNAMDVRKATEEHLRRLAAATLPGRVFELAGLHHLPVRRVSVRNQCSRWGSCSRRGTISLNWRLMQMPDRVRDYVIWHELMHLREMNHSDRFWREVAAVCPDFKEARRWLRTHRDRLH